MKTLEELLNDVIRRYNRYRSPEATARILSIEGNIVKIEFEGPFCYTCGVLDWIEDIVYEAEDLGLRIRLINVLDEGQDRKIGIFKIEN